VLNTHSKTAGETWEDEAHKQRANEQAECTASFPAPNLASKWSTKGSGMTSWQLIPHPKPNFTL
jgi:hypothetical protein